MRLGPVDLREDAGRPEPGTEPPPIETHATTMPAAVYHRLVRIVSYLFIAAVAAVNLVSSPSYEVGVWALLVVGIVLLVFFQDVLPAVTLSRWRLRVEGVAAIVFLTILLILTGGYDSPFFFGLILLLGAGTLWVTGLGPLVLTLGTAAAYLFAVAVASDVTSLSADALGRIVFNVVALVLVAYVAWVIGREQRRAREEALRLARFDALTGLFSRSFFVSTVEREIPRATRTSRPFALLMFDLDGLKAANDRYGHESGDRLLRAVAEIMRGDIRATDVAARYAGDEFLVLLPETDLSGALRVAEKLRDDIARLALPHEGSLIRTTASIGLVTFPEDGRTWPELIRRADIAMYEAKRRGRDQIVHYAREPTAFGSAPAAPAPTAISRETQQRSAGAPLRPMGPGPNGTRVPPPESSGPAPWETRPA